MWNRSENQIEYMDNLAEKRICLTFIRHGATPANQEGRYLGRTEESLSEIGRNQLEQGIRQKKYPQVTCLFTSPMKRCLETCELLYPKKNPVIIPEWYEMEFGQFEGKNYQELNGNLKYQQWIDSNGTLPFPGGESRETFVERCVRGFWQMTRQLSSQVIPQLQLDEHRMLQMGEQVTEVVCVVHGGTIMALLSHFAGGEYFDYQCKNGEGYRCQVKWTKGSGWRIPVESVRYIK